jgi:type VI secretion system protein ImpL
MSMIPKIIKAALIIAPVILFVLLIFGIVLIIDWPWWVGIFILIGLFGIGVALIFARKILLRKREQRFVSQIIEQDEAYAESLNADERPSSADLQQKWKEAIGTLKSSHLKKYGNPLYVLPWYLVLGESGSGKTTAISSARLSSPFAEINHVSGLSGTKNIDWWFSEHAVILDAAGRYAIPVDEGRDKDEWQKFLNLLARYRKREPLNGLVITIAADKLTDGNPQVLEDEGRTIRQRINELMHVLGSKFPVYVLVTKCDLIQGMTQFSEQLSDEDLEQAMGSINHTGSTDPESFTDSVMLTVGQRLRNIRLLLLHNPASRDLDPTLLLFPEEFEGLKPGLAAFMKGAFQENPYQESPILRGLFFSSGRQEGTPYSHFLKELNLIEEREVLPGTNKGLFLHDIFARILPSERDLFAPTQHALAWNRLTRNMGLVACMAIVIALCGLLSFSFVKNLTALRTISREFSRPPVLKGEIFADVGIMDRFREAVLRVEDHNANWWIPRLGLHKSKDVETSLKNTFSSQFSTELLMPFNKRVSDGVANFSESTTDVTIGVTVAHIVRRINLLKARLEGESLEDLSALPQPTYEPGLYGQEFVAELSQSFAALYLYRLIWEQDTVGLNNEMIDLQKVLNHILTVERTSLNWLTAWASETSGLPAVNMADFWGGSRDMDEAAIVAPSLTLAGKEYIESFLEELVSALEDPLVISPQRLAFQQWYEKVYIEAWYTFGEAFPDGSQRLQGKDEWLQVASRIASSQGPYITLLEKMVLELEPFSSGEEIPSWIRLIKDLEAIRTRASQLEVAKTGVIAKAAKKGEKLKKKIQKKVGTADDAMSFDSQIAAAKAHLEYFDAIKEITSTVTSSRKSAFELTSVTFKEDPATGSSQFFIAQNALTSLIEASGEPAREDFWKLLRGPLDYIWAYSCQETACHLQELWAKDVLMEVKGVADPLAVNNLLVGKDGYAMQFVKGDASAFISRSPAKGYFAKQALGRTISFEKSFLAFLTKGHQPIKSSYRVTITGLPTDVNTKATARPHATHLELQCAGNTTSMSNLNYPVRKVFEWIPGNCGDVVFSIEVGNLVLTKRYSGSLAFARFLKDFKSGQHRFYPDDFPNQRASLKSMGIRYIKVQYRIKGSTPVLKLLASGPENVPGTIISCWDR